MITYSDKSKFVRQFDTYQELLETFVEACSIKLSVGVGIVFDEESAPLLELTIDGHTIDCYPSVSELLMGVERNLGEGWARYNGLSYWL